MFGALKLQFSNPPISTNYKRRSFSVAIEPRHLHDLKKPVRQFASLSTQVEYNATAASAPSISSQYTSTVGSPSASSLQLTQWNFNHRHMLMLQAVACAVLVYCFVFKFQYHRKESFTIRLDYLRFNVESNCTLVWKITTLFSI